MLLSWITGVSVCLPLHCTLHLLAFFVCLMFLHSNLQLFFFTLLLCVFFLTSASAVVPQLDPGKISTCLWTKAGGSA